MPNVTPNTTSSPVMRGVLCVLGIAAVALGLVGNPAHAQEANGANAATRHTIALRDVPLDTALQRFIQQTGTDIAYPTELVLGHRVYCQKRDAPAEALLQCILAGTGVDYLRTSGGTYVLVDAFQAPDAVGGIVGTVVDAATGEPLSRANVLLAEASTGTATSPTGQFSFSDVLAGPHQLVVTHVGYRVGIDSVWVPSAGRQSVRVSLEPKPLLAEPLVIDGLQQRLPSSRLGQSEQAPTALNEVTGAGTPDVIQSVGRQVGVALNRPRAELHVQGSGAGEHVTLLDGAPVREPVSLGGLLSAFSPLALGRVTTHKAGFPARHGSYTAGVITTDHDLSRSETRYAAVTADPISVNGRAETRWGRRGTSAGRAMAAVRTSTWTAYQSPALRHRLSTWTHPDPTLTAWWIGPTTDPSPLRSQHPTPHVQFADLHGAAQQALSPFHHLHVSAYHGTNQMGTDAASVLDGSPPRLITSRGRTGWDNTVLQARHGWWAGARVTGSTRLFTSQHDSYALFGMRDTLLQAVRAATPVDLASLPEVSRMEHTAEGNTLKEWGGQADVTVSLSPQFRMRAAIAPHYLRGRVHVRNRFLGALEHRTSAWQVGSHWEAEASLGLGTTVTAGTRLTYLPARQTVYAEPRLSLRHDRTSSRLGGLAARLSGGIYRQYVMQSEVSSPGPMAVVPSMQFWLPIDQSLSPPRSYHVAADVLVAPSPAWSLRLETYYKRTIRTLQIDYARLVRPSPLPDARDGPLTRFDRQSDFMAAGDGYAYGAALRVQGEGARVSGDWTAELAQTARRYPGRFNERLVPAPWEQPVRLSTNVDVKIIDGLHASSTWQGAWNRPWALRRAYYDYAALTDAARALGGTDLDRPGDQVLAPFSRVDVGLHGERRIGDTTIEVQMHVVNLFNRANPFDWSINAAGPQPTRITRTLPGRRFFVLLGLRY